MVQRQRDGRISVWNRLQSGPDEVEREGHEVQRERGNQQGERYTGQCSRATRSPCLTCAARVLQGAACG